MCWDVKPRLSVTAFDLQYAKGGNVPHLVQEVVVIHNKNKTKKKCCPVPRCSRSSLFIWRYNEGLWDIKCKTNFLNTICLATSTLPSAAELCNFSLLVFWWWGFFCFVFVLVWVFVLCWFFFFFCIETNAASSSIVLFITYLRHTYLSSLLDFTNVTVER